MSVPKIIHQIAPADENKWHPLWKKCQESWRTYFSDFEYKLWNDRDDIDELVYNHYPEFTNLYNSFPVHIMRIDFARLCILHKHGGIYGDMDYFVYKNFYDQLTLPIGFIENLTEEYTSARYENSLLYSVAGHNLLYGLIKYCKACHIHFRNEFEKDGKFWRSTKNDAIVNNTTGSGMLSEMLKLLTPGKDFQGLDGISFNNRPASYDESFIGKHVHSSVWGNEYCKNDLDSFLIKNGAMYSCNQADIVQKYSQELNAKLFQVVKLDEFDFFTDYTSGHFLRHDNLEEIKEYVRLNAAGAQAV